VLQPNSPTSDWCRSSPDAGSKPVNGRVKRHETDHVKRLADNSARSKKAQRNRRKMLAMCDIKKPVRVVWQLAMYL
jgi:hypothetical protein